MKKNFLRFTVLSALFSLFLMSCDFDGLTDSTYREALNVKIGQNNTVIVSIPSISPKTEYITIYRYAITGTKPQNTDSGTPIGIVYPKNYSGESYSFEDCYAVQGNIYVYRARYFTAEDDTALTKWSSEIEVSAPNGIAASIKYNDISFDYNQVSYTLTTKTAINPDINNDPQVLTDSAARELIPMFVFSCEVGAQAIEFPKDKWDVGSEIDLRTLLPFEFFDHQVKLEGLIGMRKIVEPTDEDDITLQCLFTEVSAITINGPELITISSQAGQGGLDFS